MRRFVMALVAAGAVFGGLAGLAAVPAAADDSVRITSDVPDNREW